MSNFTITSEQIRDLHNGKCDLYQLESLIQENFKEDSPFYKYMSRAMKQLAPVISGLMAEKDKEMELIQEECEFTRKELNLKSIWSIFDRRVFPQSWRGKTVVYQGRELVIPDVEINRDVMYVIGDKLIADSEDDHHIFIEDFVEQPCGKIVMYTGS